MKRTDKASNIAYLCKYTHLSVFSGMTPNPDRRKHSKGGVHRACTLWLIRHLSSWCETT
ncbi:unnamed protein product [Nesidiocoris tenuis]|uniref:Uncharacterized protein n=1 Tax=Nesidiocoris tenuis TaxID=355587 RepID=A0A6H5HM37_9HEMI|nr:unnamed protein product [Nesidiocoris tenuis]